MKSYIQSQCKNAIASARLFEQACKIACVRDGEISKEEQKILEKISKAVTRYTKNIEKIIGRY